VVLEIKGGSEISIITPRITLVPGIYRLEAAVCLQQIGKYGIHGKNGILIECGALGFPPLRWYHEATNAVKKERTFYITSEKQTDIIAGFRKAEALFGKGTVHEISLVRLTDTTNISYAVATPLHVSSQEKLFTNLVQNGVFENSFFHWSPWQCKRNEFYHRLFIFDTKEKGIKRKGLRIKNDTKGLIGVQQNVNIISGNVYRLSGVARSTTRSDSFTLFGGRIGLWVPHQKEKQVIWMKDNTEWTFRSVIFTNRVSGMATLFVHMGYGNIANTGEFTDIRLEMIE
jgi:hypothetical protein